MKEWIVREGPRSGGIYPSRALKKVQELVRCRDCKRRKSCVTFEGLCDDNGFCSMGERSE